VTKSDSTKEAEFSAHSSRDRILAAALKLFVEQGYFNTNIPDLSRESRCSVGSIYHTFKNKEEVATALYQEGIKAFRSVLYDALRTTTDPIETVRVTVKSFMKFSEVNHQLSKYLWLCRHNEFMTGMIQHPTKIGLDPLGRLLTANIKKGIKTGVLSDLKANVIWTVMFGIPAGYVRDWLDGYNTEAPSKVSTELAELCVKSLKK
jgi:AcrR family transcriptional regulator